MNKYVDNVALDKIVDQQYRNYGGWCGYCGEAVSPFHYRLPEDMVDTACEYNGNHPDCGNHDMKLILSPNETLGNYEIWECQNINCGWTESY